MRGLALETKQRAGLWDYLMETGRWATHFTGGQLQGCYWLRRRAPTKLPLSAPFAHHLLAHLLDEFPLARLKGRNAALSDCMDPLREWLGRCCWFGSRFCSVLAFVTCACLSCWCSVGNEGMNLGIPLKETIWDDL